MVANVLEHGRVGRRAYNAIDPQLYADRDGTPWLTFGSLWSGIKITRIDAATGRQLANATRLESITRRKVEPDAIEAPFLVAHGDFHYLFVSFDFSNRLDSRRLAARTTLGDCRC